MASERRDWQVIPLDFKVALPEAGAPFELSMRPWMIRLRSGKRSLGIDAGAVHVWESVNLTKSIHAIHVSMQKIQILFPDPLMERMRRVAARVDLPVSEIVRRATEHWLDRMPESPRSIQGVPTVDAGRCLVPADEMREVFYE